MNQRVAGGHRVGQLGGLLDHGCGLGALGHGLSLSAIKWMDGWVGGGYLNRYLLTLAE